MRTFTIRRVVRAIEVREVEADSLAEAKRKHEDGEGRIVIDEVTDVYSETVRDGDTDVTEEWGDLA